MKKRFILLIIVIFTISSFCYLWWQQAISPVDKNDTTNKIFLVKRGQDVRTIAKNLRDEGFIRDSIAFFLLVRFGGLGYQIQSGDFRLSPSYDMKSIATTLTHGTLDVWITALEGWRNEEIASKVAQSFDIPESEFVKEAKIGYMFPDTYLIPKDASIGAIVNLFLNNFDKKVDSSITQKARAKGFSLNEVVTIASLVEREARYDDDRPIVGSVILNRLKLGMKLDIDATIQYILGYQPDEKTWWKKELTEDDLKIISPYNTYLNSGLPPSPVANPGLAAIKAVVDAPSTDYLYYVSDKNGKIHPAKTVEEHNQNVSKYLNR